MVKAILFTGAGANFPLGFPTTEALFNKIESEEIRILQQNLFKTISRMNDVEDIEHIWSILEKIEETDKLNEEFNFFKSQAQLNLQNGNNPWTEVMKQVHDLKIEIEDIIFKEYTFTKDLEKSAYRLYDMILLFMEKLNKDEKQIQIPIFTTNYDRVLEEVSLLFESKGYNIIDGFVVKSQLKPPKWDSQVFQKIETKLNLLIFKLHGSLQWRKNIDGDIEKPFGETPQRDDKNYPQNLLIYPGNYKEPNEEPFITLHNKFEQYLSESQICFIIGFACRDEYINNIIINSLKTNKKLRIIWITPDAKEMIEENQLFTEINDISSIQNERFIPISSAFEKLNIDHLYNIINKNM